MWLMALMIVTRPSFPSLSALPAADHWVNIHLRNIFPLEPKSIFVCVQSASLKTWVFLHAAAVYVHPCCRSTIGSLWYDLAWQHTIQDATVCHSTEIEELISLHQSAAFYKYSKALCSLPLFLFSFLLLSLFSPLPSPFLPLSVCPFIFLHTLCLPHPLFPHAPVIQCGEMCLVCLERSSCIKREQKHACCISFLSL